MTREAYTTRSAGYLPEMLDTIDRFRKQEQREPSPGSPSVAGAETSEGGGLGARGGARVVLVKPLIEPYSFYGARNVLNNWNIAAMNLAAAEALASPEVQDSVASCHVYCRSLHDAESVHISHACWLAQGSKQDIFLLNTWPLVGAKAADCSYDGSLPTPISSLWRLPLISFVSCSSQVCTTTKASTYSKPKSSWRSWPTGKCTSEDNVTLQTAPDACTELHPYATNQPQSPHMHASIKFLVFFNSKDKKSGKGLLPCIQTSEINGLKISRGVP